MTKELVFDIFDLFNELTKIKLKIFIVSSLYFLILFFGNNYLSSLSKTNKYIDISIDVSSYLDLPEHYLNLDNLLVWNSKFEIEKSSISRNFLEDNQHVLFFSEYYHFDRILSDEIKKFIKLSKVDFISDTKIKLIIDNHDYVRSFEEKDLKKFIEYLNINLYKKILNNAEKLNNSVKTLEDTIKKNQIEIEFQNEHNYDFNLGKNPFNLNKLNSVSIKEFKNNDHFNFYKNGGFKYLQNQNNPLVIFNKTRLVVLSVITYCVIIFMITILSYGRRLKKVDF
tara:strand:- start:127 stop:972 length:846 start_codon:yes stop_codon:yes gene_type:complete